MIGKHHIEIDARDFVKGVSTSSEVADGGFSPQTDAVNITAVPGVLYAPASSVDSDTDARLQGNLIASSPDMVVTSPTNRILVDDTGRAYKYNGTKITAAGVSLTAAQTWTAGFTDILTFGGEAYISSKASLTRLQSDDTVDAGASWPFSFTTANVPHPGIVYENSMYWGDKNLLLIQSSIGDAVAPTTVLTLAANQVIVALGIDPGTGYMLISTKNVLDVSSTIATTNRILWYDGNSAKVIKSAIVEEAPLSFQPVGAVVYVGYSNNIGYLSGSGIQFLRRLDNVAQDNTELPYKHKLCAIGNTLYVLNGKQVYAFGEVLPGRKVWYPAWSNPVNLNEPTFLADVGNKKLGMGFATTKFYTFDTSSVATTGTMSCVFNWLPFPRPVHIRGFYVEYYDSVANNDANRTLYYKHETSSGFQIVYDASNTFTALKNVSGASTIFIDVPIASIATGGIRSLQLRYNTDTGNLGLKRIIVYYDVAE